MGPCDQAMSEWVKDPMERWSGWDISLCRPVCSNATYARCKRSNGELIAN